MTRFLSCGRYKCAIIGSSDLIRCIPQQWLEEDETQLANSEITRIYLEKETVDYKNGLSEGWIIRKDHEKSEAVYVHKGREVFSLQPVTVNEVVVRIRKAVDSYVRAGIHYGIMAALHQHCIGLHGVTLLCGNEIIILSAPSGTGKTTLASLLEATGDAITINGDFALLSFAENSVFFEPTPFCGTSGRALNHRFRVNRVVFLSQSEKNEWRELVGREATMQFMSNAFIPTWDSKLQQAVQKNILKYISAVRVNAYAFAPNQEAAEEFLKHIEK